MAGKWPKSSKGLSINELELLTVAIAAARFGPDWARRRVIAHVDNMAAVYTINAGAAKAAPLMVGMRQLYLQAARHGFQIVAKHIPTEENVAADAASRGEWARFLKYTHDVLNIPAIEQVSLNLDLAVPIARMQKARLGAIARARRG